MPQKHRNPVCRDRAAAGVIGYGNNQHSLDNPAVLRTQASPRLQRQRHVEQVHRLGARVIFELVDELDRHHGLGDDLDRRLERYAGLDPEVLPAVGGDRFPSAPLRVVGGGR